MNIDTLTKQQNGNNNQPYSVVGRKPKLNSDWKINNVEAEN